MTSPSRPRNGGRLILRVLFPLLFGLLSAGRIWGQDPSPDPLRTPPTDPARISPPAPPPPRGEHPSQPRRESVPLPRGLKKPLSGDPEGLLKVFLGVPYRTDGTVSALGGWTLWADESRVFQTPGLNCSGFLLAAARLLLGENFTLEEARRDYFQDSGKGSPWGEDWDFGLDAVLNLAGLDPPELLPEAGPTLFLNDHGRPTGLGADIHSPAFPELLASLEEGSTHFFAVSKPDRRFPAGLSYYHNGVILVSGGKALLYHATRGRGTHSLNLSDPRVLGNFRKAFPPVKNGGERRMLLARVRPRVRLPFQEGDSARPRFGRALVF